MYRPRRVKSSHNGTTCIHRPTQRTGDRTSERPCKRKRTEANDAAERQHDRWLPSRFIIVYQSTLDRKRSLSDATGSSCCIVVVIQRISPLRTVRFADMNEGFVPPSTGLPLEGVYLDVKGPDQHARAVCLFAGVQTMIQRIPFPGCSCAHNTTHMELPVDLPGFPPFDLR